MARPTPLSNTAIAALRTTTAATQIVADSATLTDANFDPTLGVNCTGFDTIFVSVEITGGSAPTATIEPLFRDGDAPDGSRWKRILLGSLPGVTLAAAAAPTTGALDGTNFVEVRVFGHKNVFLRITAVANPSGTTQAIILGKPGALRGFDRNPFN